MMQLKLGATALTAIVLLSSCSSSSKPEAAGAEQGQGDQHPDISGFWELVSDSKHVSPASVTPLGTQLADKERPKVDEGVITTYASRWCQPLGTPFIMGDAAPLDILQTPREIAIIAEVQSSARHIYMDGRGHPDMDVFDPTTNGHSIGHWEGQTLVVETVGFNDRGNLLLPGGGVRTPSAKLVEHYELLAEGKELKVTFTWEDPQIFTQPHTYYFMYYKSAADQYAREYFCDASDANRTKTSEEPTQRE
jgi:hypothetical protein